MDSVSENKVPALVSEEDTVQGLLDDKFSDDYFKDLKDKMDKGSKPVNEVLSAHFVRFEEISPSLIKMGANIRKADVVRMLSVVRSILNTGWSANSVISVIRDKSGNDVCMYSALDGWHRTCALVFVMRKVPERFPESFKVRVAVYEGLSKTQLTYCAFGEPFSFSFFSLLSSLFSLLSSLMISFSLSRFVDFSLSRFLAFSL